MTSSLPNFTRRPPEDVDPWGAIPAPRLLEALTRLTPSGFPGSFEYSNTSYFLLAELLESPLLDGPAHDYRQTVRERVWDNAQDEERTQLARDLHDEIGPLLFSLGLDAAAVQRALGDTASHEVKERLEQIREAVRISQRTVLDILGRLRTGSVDDLGLAAGISRLIDFWQARHPHLIVHADIPEEGVGRDLDAVVYRVVQESFSNAVRHGSPVHVDITVSKAESGDVEITVTDDGGGLKSQKAGHGITGMRERVTSRNGMLAIENRKDKRGTVVHAIFPAAPALQSVSRQHVGAA